MSSCFIKRVLPFALAFLCGVAAWQLIDVKLRAVRDVLYLEHGWTLGTPPPDARAGTWAFAGPAGEESRTWLFVRSSPSVVPASGAARACGGCSVRMRVLFGEDGAAVPGTGFSLAPSSYPILEDAVRAARAVAFTPATRNGRPVPVWANATYACGPEELRPHSNAYRHLCSLTVDKDSGRTWDGRPWRVVVTTNE